MLDEGLLPGWPSQEIKGSGKKPFTYRLRDIFAHVLSELNESRVHYRSSNADRNLSLVSVITHMNDNPETFRLKAFVGSGVAHSFICTALYKSSVGIQRSLNEIKVSTDAESSKGNCVTQQSSLAGHGDGVDGLLQLLASVMESCCRKR